MITPKLLRDWAACWSSDSIAAHFAGRTELTPREIANDESIPLDDRLWVLCKTLWYLDESAARGFAIETALLVAHLSGDEDDQAQYLGLCNRLLEIEDLAADHRAAAWDAARDAARAAAWDAARDAARAAAWDAARAAARAAARDAAWAAARAAAWDAALAAAWAAAWDAALAAARDEFVRKSLARALEWLGDYADGWEES